MSLTQTKTGNKRKGDFMSRRNAIPLAIFVAILLTPLLMAANDTEINLDVKEKVLSNGMTILVVENHIAPVASMIIRYRVGAVDEQTGYTGMSHFLEHMMFKGSTTIGTTDYEAEAPLMKKIDSLGTLLRAEKNKIRKPGTIGNPERVKQLRDEIAAVQSEQAQFIINNEFYNTYLENGGSGINASTGSDGTQYYVSLPVNRLELWAFMESDRMANLAFREFYSERDVIREERRQTTETRTYGLLYEALNATAHWSSPYRWQAIGWASDIENYQLEDMKKYFRAHYHPGNAIAVIVGDVNPDDIFSLCEKYFGAIPAGPMPDQVFTDDRHQMGQRIAEVEFDANPMAMIGWHMPESTHPDTPILDVISDILNAGRTSRFYKNLTEKKIASSTAYISFSRYPDLFTAGVTPMGDYSLDEAIDSTLAQIELLKTEPVEQWELERIRKRAQLSLYNSLQSNPNMAYRLAHYTALCGNWEYMLKFREACANVTPEDIMRVASKYFVKNQRTIVKLIRPEDDTRAEADNQKGGHL